MAFTNTDIFNLTKYLANKSGLGGYMRINDFNLNLKSANILLLKEKLGLSNDYQLGAPISRKQKGLSSISDDEIRQFKTKADISFSSGIGSLPETYFKYDDVRVSGALEPVEVLTSSELSRRINNAIDAPDVLFPAAEILGSQMYIYPTTITTASLIFYRYPVTPALSYYISADGEIVPLAVGATHTIGVGEVGMNGEAEGIEVTSTTVEHEWNSESAIELVYIIVKNMGINLMRGDVFQAATQIKTQGV